MKRKMYILELIDFDHYDEVDKENVEERYIIGYFFNTAILDEAIILCKKRKNSNEKIVLNEINFECSPNQKYVYVLFYEYSKYVNNEINDYYDYFEPYSNRLKCNRKKEKLLLEDKYKVTDDKVFDDSLDGFRVEKIRIDFISHINFLEKT